MKDPAKTDLTGRLKWVERTAYLLDDKFKFPGTNFRFGLDPIINLIPIAGDITGFIISGMLMIVMAKQGVSRKVVILMALNVFLDAIIGGIPILGQIFDFYYKANTRNINLLKAHYQEGKYKGSGTGLLVSIFLVLFVILSLLLYLLYKVGEWFLGLF